MSTKTITRHIRDFLTGDYEGAPIVYVMALAIVFAAMVLTVITA